MSTSAEGSSVAVRRQPGGRGRPNISAGYFFILPALIFLSLAIVVPILAAVKLSFQEVDYRASVTTFVGLENYARLITDNEFWASFWRAFVFSLATTIGHAVLGCAAAMLILGNWASIRVRNFVRGLLILPWLFSLSAAALIWGLLYQPSGPINYLLTSWNLRDTPIDFLGDPNLAIWSLVIIGVWKAYPFYFIMILSALQSIPQDLYEAAKIDGASAMERFRFVTLPLLKPVLVATTTLDMITTFATFDLIKVMTNGGPLKSTQTVSFYIWQVGFRDVDVGYGAAMSVVTLIVLLGATILYLKYTSKKGDEANGSDI